MSAAGAQANAPAARAASKRRPAELVLMHLGRALKVGLCMGPGRGGRRDRIEAVVRIAANAIIADDHRAGRTPNVDRVLRWARRRGLDIDDRRVEQIAIDEVATGYLYSIEDRGDMLRITPEERVHHGVWSLGAYGQTIEERVTEAKARKECRRQERLAKSRAATAQRRGPHHVNVSAIAREFSLSRPTVRALKLEWEKACAAGHYDNHFASFCRARLYNNRYSYKGVPLDRNEVCLVLNISAPTFYRWKKNTGKIESELKVARPSKAAAALLRQRKREIDSRISDAPRFMEGDQMEETNSGLVVDIDSDAFDRVFDQAEKGRQPAADRAAARFKVRVLEGIIEKLSDPDRNDRRVA